MKSSIPLSIPVIKGNEWRYVKECLDTGWVSSVGEYVERFENDICAYTKAKHAVACVNCTAGLQVALEACGVRPGDEVIVPTITFIAPVNAVRHAGAHPVFMDCDRFMNMDADKVLEFCRKECRLTKSGLKNKRSGRTVRVILCVHVFGNPCDLVSLKSTAEKFGLKLIEDAAESLGSYFSHGKLAGRHTGTIGDAGVYSFNGNKVITTGSGGCIVTDSKKTADAARYLTAQAKDDPVRYVHNEAGYNFRMTSLQAAMGVAQLEKIEDFIAIKRRNYEIYRNELGGINGVSVAAVPGMTRPNYWLYSLMIDKSDFGISRDALMNYLGRHGIETRPLWMPNHLQRPYLKDMSYRIEKADRFWKSVLNIPSSASLSASDAKLVAAKVKNVRSEI
jgi:aminotransferase in exopolysaccharide biosynthesis